MTHDDSRFSGSTTCFRFRQMRVKFGSGQGAGVPSSCVKNRRRLPYLLHVLPPQAQPPWAVGRWRCASPAFGALTRHAPHLPTPISVTGPLRSGLWPCSRHATRRRTQLAHGIYSFLPYRRARMQPGGRRLDTTLQLYLYTLTLFVSASCDLPCQSALSYIEISRGTTV